MIGSSNLTNRALSQNHEWNLKVSAATGSDLANQLSSLLDEQIAASEPLTQEWIDEYAATYVAPPRRDSRTPAAPVELAVRSLIEPNVMQQDALLALDFARAQGDERAIVISATGTGKTMLSALDVRSVNPTTHAVRRSPRADSRSHHSGVSTGTGRSCDRLRPAHWIQQASGPALRLRHRFRRCRKRPSSRRSRTTPSTTSSSMRPTAPGRPPTSVSSIDSSPAFLLGMTATPERTDGFNVFELFHYNVPYEIRLSKALEAEMLCPFHYYGIADVTYDDAHTTTDDTPLHLLISPERVKHLIRRHRGSTARRASHLADSSSAAAWTKRAHSLLS